MSHLLLLLTYILQKTEAVAMAASVVQVAPSMKEEEDKLDQEGDQKLELYQKGTEYAKVCHV